MRCCDTIIVPFGAVADRLQPCELPENQAACLASAVCRSVATGVEVDGILHAPSADREHRVAGLVRALIDVKTTAAECEHLRHERHAVELAVLVESTQDFILAANLEPVAYLWLICQVSAGPILPC